MSAKYTFIIGVLLVIKVNKVLLTHLYTKVIIKENFSLLVGVTKGQKLKEVRKILHSTPK